MPDQPSNDTGACLRCGIIGRETLIASRVTKASQSGHFNVFRCEVCGAITQRDAPQEAPRD